MRTDGIVDFLPVAEFAVEFFHLQRAGRDLVELLGVGAIGGFDGAVEFGRTWRQDEEMKAALLAGLLELGGKLRAAIDRDGADGKRHAVLQSVEELGGGLSDGARVRLQHVPAGNALWYGWSEMQRDLTDIKEMAAEIRRSGHAPVAVSVAPVKKATK